MSLFLLNEISHRIVFMRCHLNVAHWLELSAIQITVWNVAEGIGSDELSRAVIVAFPLIGD